MTSSHGWILPTLLVAKPPLQFVGNPVYIQRCNTLIFDGQECGRETMTKNKKKEKSIKKITNVKPKPQSKPQSKSQSKLQSKANAQQRQSQSPRQTPERTRTTERTNEPQNEIESNKQVKNNNSQLSSLQQKFQKKLEGARFRTINERLYTCRGDEAFGEFQQNSNLFHLVSSFDLSHSLSLINLSLAVP
jgi:hypothetical protein